MVNRSCVLRGLVGASLWLQACTGNVSGVAAHPNTPAAGSTAEDPNGDAGLPAIPFAPQPAQAYVGKVKNILVGTAPTADEISAVAADPDTLRDTIKGWTQTPEYRAKMLQFFGSAFQQTQVIANDFANQNGELRGYGAPYLLQNLQQSFARTALELIDEGVPFTETMTTRRFMVTPPLLMFYGYVDTRRTPDRGGFTNLLLQQNPNFTMKFQASRGPIALADSLNPANPNYMTWYLPRLATPSTNPNCGWTDPLVIDANAKIPTDRATELYRYLVNNEVQVSSTTQANVSCGPSSAYDGNTAMVPYGDYNNWRMVSFRTPNPNEATTPFWDLATLRSASQVVMRVPRVGFYTTPAFLAGWQTNGSNQARVTMNQTLIVGLNHALDGTDTAKPLSEAAVDPVHAPQGSACYGCHQTLDPMRQFFRSQYTLNFGVQQDPNQMKMLGQFAFDGVSVAGADITSLGSNLASHSRFAQAWAEKLCAFANSAPCLATDPELVRIANVFAASRYDWTTLVVEMFSSPLVTYASATQSATANGVTLSVLSQERLCAMLQVRLGLSDPCGHNPGTSLPATLRTLPTIMQIMPSLQYARGQVDPVSSIDATLFFSAGMENLCGNVANAVVDAGTNSRYVSSDPNTAMEDMVHNLMGVQAPDDAQALSILQSNYQDSLAQPAIKAVDALKNTFVLACMSPSTLGLGL